MVKWSIFESCSEEIIGMFEVNLIAFFKVSLVMWYKKNKFENCGLSLPYT